jgi:hypothetical protein
MLIMILYQWAGKKITVYILWWNFYPFAALLSEPRLAQRVTPWRESGPILKNSCFGQRHASTSVILQFCKFWFRQKSRVGNGLLFRLGTTSLKQNDYQLIEMF